MEIIIFSILIFLLIGAFVYAVIIYNTIIKYQNNIDNAFSSIDVMLKKRHELIPNLVNAVQGFMAHEKAVLVEITTLRNSATNDNLSKKRKMMIENGITQSIGYIMVKAEDYPDLKSSENFLQLQQALNETEEHISASRRFYNSAVTFYNNSIQTFPNSIIARLFKFKKKRVFEALNSEKQVVDIEESLS